ncbi:MAG TPA: hypothetical protein VLE43_07240 [Candidatus Saccharimonadia bacterium]|nr:hypothetical protein [Candidatus Saccharimonadia bacterium]
MKLPSDSPWPSATTSCDVSAQCHGRIRVRYCTKSFGFEIRACNPVSHPSLVFALVEDSRGRQNPVQFAVRVDLESGEIWDIANNTGVIGWLERDLWPSSEEEYPLVLRWEIERAGDALIPRLQIGDEEWLYPSVLFSGDAPFAALSGHNIEGLAHRDVFSPGYVWSQDRIARS